MGAASSKAGIRRGLEQGSARKGTPAMFYDGGTDPHRRRRGNVATKQVKKRGQDGQKSLQQKQRALRASARTKHNLKHAPQAGAVYVKVLARDRKRCRPQEDLISYKKAS